MYNCTYLLDVWAILGCRNNNEVNIAARVSVGNCTYV